MKIIYTGKLKQLGKLIKKDPGTYEYTEAEKSYLFDVLRPYLGLLCYDKSMNIISDSNEYFIKNGYLRYSNFDSAYLPSEKYKNVNIQDLRGVFFNSPWKSKAESLSFSATPYELGTESKTFLIPEGLKYTFGVEIETIRGEVDINDIIRENINCESHRDGSLRDPDGSEWGAEYVTGVLKGDSGFQNLQKLINLLSKKTLIDKRCGIHVHVGSANFTDEFSILAYILAIKLQKELYSVVSPSRRENETCHSLSVNLATNYLNNIKEYGYSRGIEMSYIDFFKRLSNNRELDAKINKEHPHPGGRYTDRYERGISPSKLFRYALINFIPCNFNMKGSKKDASKLNNGISYTLEFRLHQASLNYKKIRNWVLLCLAFVRYVENNQKDILSKKKITIADVLKEAYPKKYEELSFYFEQRKKELGESSYNEDSSEYKDLEAASQKFLSVKEEVCV